MSNLLVGNKLRARSIIQLLCATALLFFCAGHTKAFADEEVAYSLTAVFDVSESAKKIKLKELDDKTVPVGIICQASDGLTPCTGTVTLKARFKKGHYTTLCEGPFYTGLETSYIDSLGCQLSSSTVKKIKKAKKPVLLKLAATLDSGNTSLGYFADSIYIKK